MNKKKIETFVTRKEKKFTCKENARNFYSKVVKEKRNHFDFLFFF